MFCQLIKRTDFGPKLSAKMAIFGNFDLAALFGNLICPLGNFLQKNM